MISFHPRKCDFDKTKYAFGYRVYNTTDLQRLATTMCNYVWSPIIWKTGHRCNENFHRADFIGLDFDGTMTLDDAKNTFCDCVMVIGTTKSHRVVKDGVIADRFRVVLRTELTITNLTTYRHAVKKYIDHYDADQSCADGARFFWPCKDIIVVNPDGDPEEIEVLEEKSQDHYDPKQIRVSRDNFKRFGLPRWIKLFLDKGQIPRWYGSRNYTCNQVARRLLCLQFSPEQIIGMLKKSPFNRKFSPLTGKDRVIDDREIERTVKSATQYVGKRVKDQGGIGDYQERKKAAKEWFDNRGKGERSRRDY